MKFEKVSLNQYMKDFEGDLVYASNRNLKMLDILNHNVYYASSFDTLKSIDSLSELYGTIKIPARATKGSAGYDIFAPYDFSLLPGETIKLSTGIRVLLDEDKFLMCVPRSGHGFKYRAQLDNTVGIIDSDYSSSDNEGHIMIKITNDSHTGKTFSVRQGEGIAQAIILQYFKVDEDSADNTRNGGFGSTDKESK